MTSTCPSADGCISKTWRAHAMEDCSALKTNEVLTHSTTCMNLANLMQSERSQSQKDITPFDTLYKKHPEEAIPEAQKAGYWTGCRAGETGVGDNEDRVSFGGWWKYFCTGIPRVAAGTMLQMH